MVHWVLGVIVGVILSIIYWVCLTFVGFSPMNIPPRLIVVFPLFIYFMRLTMESIFESVVIWGICAILGVSALSVLDKYNTISSTPIEIESHR